VECAATVVDSWQEMAMQVNHPVGRSLIIHAANFRACLDFQFATGGTPYRSFSVEPVVPDNEVAATTIEVSLPEAQTTIGKEMRARGPRRASSRPRPDNPGASEVLNQVLVSMTIKLPHRVAQTLDHAYVEQRLKYSKRRTLQQIAEEALTDWPAKSGYLD
jgi:hypothetical protein